MCQGDRVVLSFLNHINFLAEDLHVRFSVRLDLYQRLRLFKNDASLAIERLVQLLYEGGPIIGLVLFLFSSPVVVASFGRLEA